MTRTFVWTVLILIAVQSNAQEVFDTWRYQFRKPADNWQQATFDDTHWREGQGGFGTFDTPGTRVGTVWNGNNIWMRKTFSLNALPAKPGLLIHHDEDAEVFINGKLAYSVDGYVTEYKVVALEPAAIETLRVGKNVLAVHCKQTGGGQFIDVHVIDVDHRPTLPQPIRSTTPYQSDLITKWGESLTPEEAWTEYPRPQLERTSWTNLNGKWDYAITKAEQQTTPTEWTGKILVPFALESKLSGVQRILLDDEALWYRRTWESQAKSGTRTLLNFEAVDYRSEVFVNGKSVGEHQGGHTPFTLDITDATRPGQNELVVRVEDDTEGYQLRGKQVINPNGIWYTQVSGIWQTVWLENVNPTYIEDMTIQTDATNGSFTLRADIVGNSNGNSVRLTVLDGGQEAAQVSGPPSGLEIKLQGAKLWSPDSPHLYRLRIELLDAKGNVLDQVASYVGIRSVGKKLDAAGHLRFTLNGKEIFHWGPLDQGWWPDGLLTPPSDEAMRFDIEYLKAAGFNMIRKHIKVEPRRYYYHCDQLGVMLWQDQVSAGNNPKWTRLAPNPEDANWPDAAHDQFMIEFERMIDSLENHPSIVAWVPFNEAWGQHRTVEVGKWAVKRDPSRIINIASGGNFWPIGDVVDEHHYPHPEYPFNESRDKGFVKVMGEFGGHGYPVKDHLWNDNQRNWGYGGLPATQQEYRERYETSLKKLADLKKQGIAAGVYTQTTDVEEEINGLMTYDRKVIKIPAQELAQLHRILFE